MGPWRGPIEPSQNPYSKCVERWVFFNAPKWVVLSIFLFSSFYIESHSVGLPLHARWGKEGTYRNLRASEHRLNSNTSSFREATVSPVFICTTPKCASSSFAENFFTEVCYPRVSVVPVLFFRSLLFNHSLSNIAKLKCFTIHPLTK